MFDVGKVFKNKIKNKKLEKTKKKKKQSNYEKVYHARRTWPANLNINPSFRFHSLSLQQLFATMSSTLEIEARE